ncbi:MAG: hypothetical protein LBH17_05575 [Oscillospiraceae bacterium]|jgi:hypothetical protein|nr:hypothetical protein [Oscillospiraceae bacterium]
MIFFLVLAIIIAVIAAIMLLRVGARVNFAEGELTVRANIAFVGFNVFPRPKKAKISKKQRQRGEEKKPRRGKKTKTAARAEKTPRSATQLARGAVRVLDKLRRRVLVKRLYVYYVHGGADDPYSAAMAFGGLSAALGLAAGALERVLHIRRYDIRESVDFLSSSSRIYAEAAVSLAVWEVISIAVAAFLLFVRSGKAKPAADAGDNATDKNSSKNTDTRAKPENKRGDLKPDKKV